MNSNILIALKMKTKQLAMRSSRPKATRVAALELLKSVWVVLTKLVDLLLAIIYIIFTLLRKVARLFRRVIIKLWTFKEFRGFVAGFSLAALIAVFLFSQFVHPLTLGSGVSASSEPVQQITTEQPQSDSNVEVVEEEIVEKPEVVEEEKPQPEPVIEFDWDTVDFVTLTYTEKVEMLKKRLRLIGVPENEVNTYIRIATLESCRDKGNHTGCMNPTKTPPVAVKHCRSASSGNWYVVEISSTGGQAYCAGGDTEGRNEKSMGIFQILETTWTGHKCEGDRGNWLDQVQCAKQIRDISGFNSWSTY